MNPQRAIARIAIPFTLALAALASPVPTAFAQGLARGCVELKVKPYSSSYLPSSQGYMTRVRGLGIENGHLLDPSLVHHAFRSTVAERFDRLRSGLLGKAPLKPYFDSLHRPGAADWEGVCHQWAPAALDPQINELIARTQGIACGGTVLTKGALKELFTALYDVDAESEFHGNRSRSAKPREASRRAVRGPGLDDLPAHVLHNELFENLSLGRGLVMDVDGAHQVWNQPVFGACSDFAPRSFGLGQLLTPVEGAQEDGGGTVALAGKLPLLAYEGRTEESASFLAAMLELRAVLRERAGSDDAGAEGDPGEPARWAARLGLDPGSHRDFSWLWRSAIDTRLTRLVESGEIALRGDAALYRVRTIVKYGMEVPFATLNEKYESAPYDFYAVEKNGQVIDSAWITPLELRPDFVWIPARVDLSGRTRPANPSLEAALDLIGLLKGGSGCVDVSEVSAYLSRLQQALGSGRALDEATRGQLLDGYARVRAAVNRDLVRQLVSRAPGSGLGIADFQ